MDSKENIFKNPWVAIGLPALTILLGTQILKALFPLLLYVLGDRFRLDGREYRCPGPRLIQCQLPC